METSSALLALSAGNPPVTVEFPAQRPVKRNFAVFFDQRLNKQSWGWWFGTPLRPWWWHCNAADLFRITSPISYMRRHTTDERRSLLWNMDVIQRIWQILLLLISMLCHRQAIFESKGNKLSSSAEYRIRTQGLWNRISSSLNARWQIDWAIEDQVSSHWQLNRVFKNIFILTTKKTPRPASAALCVWGNAHGASLKTQLVVQKAVVMRNYGTIDSIFRGSI